MNVYISVDMEGITGIVHGDMMGADGREYDRGRRLMTGDANAAIEGAVNAGADYILVADGQRPRLLPTPGGRHEDVRRRHLRRLPRDGQDARRDRATHDRRRRRPRATH